MKRFWLNLKPGKDLLVYAPPRVLRIRLVASAKPMRTVDKVLNQWVDWVAWASIQTSGARDAIDDACATSSAVQWWKRSSSATEHFQKPP